ncbi:MAG: glycosyltransferase family 4 protein [Anaerolineales bacterium]|nr:glycosyltransferase family 4 protein [Anaerolineales bacterium]
MKILTALTYYRPHHSGLTIYTERLARALSKRGHEITILTSLFDPELKDEEHINGVKVQRMPVMFHLSKGVIMPKMWIKAWGLVKDADVVHLHLPQFDAMLIALYARLMRKPVLVTYHCDLLLPKGLIHSLANLGSDITNLITASLADKIIANSQDYIDHSPFLLCFKDKCEAIAPPIITEELSEEQAEAFRKANKIEAGQKVIGMMGRLATEKGAEFAIEAMPEILKRYPNARIIHGGQYKNVMGEEKYYEKLAPLIEALGSHWQFLGVVTEEQKSALFHHSDVLVAPSLNSTESYGMVQMEAMFCGTPAVCFDLPGSREPVRVTGMGEIVPMKDVHALAETIIRVLENSEKYQGDVEKIRREYSPEASAEKYEKIIEVLVGK